MAKKKTVLDELSPPPPIEITVREGQEIFQVERTIYINVQSEYDFLIDLLRAQEDGNWHGPAASMIRERLKLISNG